jgi:hypothetical protein
MQFATETTAVQNVVPMTITITLETADDYRWFYHLMNFKNKEIETAYDNSSIGVFGDRFQEFQVPDKKPLFKAVKAAMAEQNIGA